MPLGYYEDRLLFHKPHFQPTKVEFSKIGLLIKKKDLQVYNLLLMKRNGFLHIIIYRKKCIFRKVQIYQYENIPH